MSYHIIPVTSFAQNCSLLWCDETLQAALIDPGGEANKLIQAVEKRKLTLTKILLTHGHLDHVGATAAIAKHFGVDIIGPHQADQFWLDALAEQGQMFGFGQTDSFKPDQWLKQGDEVNVGNICLDVRFCPGHTPGHIVFIDHLKHIAWVGDVLFNRSIGRTDFPQGNYEQLIQSIREQLLTLEDNYVIIPGHGPSSTIGDERSHNPFLR
ncbi:MAG: Hydroxyacylglutathione hydrolase GloC [Candidatus Celerinatantimonas neptuna]|nr:MAG: Hydroxyacylglutathione hydrolase GloC [Candidatus Celerinatantimonas neptuna]